MGITDSVKDILTVKIKPRHDSYSDQFSRILMVKVMMVGTLLVGLNWYSDKMQCIMSSGATVGGGFVSSACWINGLYIFREIGYHSDVGYYGIPRDINYDGKYANGQLCPVKDVNKGCEPMHKTFYVQYQFLTFLLAVFAALYYSPYAFFSFVNQDVKSLKTTVEADNDGSGAENIVSSYFNPHINSRNKMRLRLIGNVVVKVLYIVVNVVAFVATDSLLLGGFQDYGNAWLSWANLSNFLAYDYTSGRKTQGPKPGNTLLPSYGLCEVHESSQDIKQIHKNKYKFVCEISQHVLYQYAFIIIWFAMVAGIIIAIVGLIIHLVDHIITALCFLRGSGEGGRKMYKKLCLRECQYLEYIRRKNMPLYGNVLALLRRTNPVPYKGTNDEKNNRAFMMADSGSYEI